MVSAFEQGTQVPSADTTVVFLFESKTEAPSSEPFKKAMNEALAPLRKDGRVAFGEAPADVGPKAQTRSNTVAIP